MNTPDFVSDDPAVNAQADYFGQEEFAPVYLPDGISFVQVKIFTEGDRRNYLNKTNRLVRFRKGSGDAEMQLAPGEERKVLLETAITGWNLARGGTPVPFNANSLRQFLTSANPKIIDTIEKEVRKLNPWLLSDLSAEDIRKEIAELQEMLAVKEAEEQGN